MASGSSPRLHSTLTQGWNSSQQRQRHQFLHPQRQKIDQNAIQPRDGDPAAITPAAKWSWIGRLGATLLDHSAPTEWKQYVCVILGNVVNHSSFFFCYNKDYIELNLGLSSWIKRLTFWFSTSKKEETLFLWEKKKLSRKQFVLLHMKVFPTLIFFPTRKDYPPQIFCFESVSHKKITSFLKISPE